MWTRRLIATASAAALAVALSASGAGAAPGDRSDHGHLLLLDVEVAPGSFPPIPTSVRACIELAAGQPVPQTAHHDQLHVDFDGGDFTARTGHVVVPTFPYAAPGRPAVPWSSCEDFMTFFGLG